MRLQVSKTKNAASFYVVQSIYDRKTKKRSNIIVEKLGTYEMLKEQYPDQDPYEWAKKYVETLNEEEKKQKEPSLQMSFSPSEPIAMEKKYGITEAVCSSRRCIISSSCRLYAGKFKKDIASTIHSMRSSAN